MVINATESGDIERERHDVSVSKVHDVEVDVTGCNSRQDVRDQAAHALRGLIGCARLTIIGELTPEIDLKPDDLPTVEHGLDELVVRFDRLTVGYDLDAIAQEATVRGQFVRDLMAVKVPSDKERHRILVTGLRALDARDDLEVN